MGIFTKDPSVIDSYGYRIKWGPKHMTDEQLRPLIFSYDKVATEACDALDEIVPPVMPAPRKSIEHTVEPKDIKKHRDIWKLVQEHSKADPRVAKIWDEVNTVPDWVDWDQLERGQKIFWRYGGPAMTALTFLSLLGGMGGGRTVETLDRTGGFGSTAVRRRLLETTQHTLNVHKDLESIKPGGDGWEASVRVRLLHASVRRRIMELAKNNPEYYDIQAHGIPVNDLDCMGTIGTFSVIIIWMGLPRQGIYLREQEIDDYLALWRYVAYLMGTPHDWLGDRDAAKAMMESLYLSEVRPTEKSAVLANNIITGFEGQPPTFASRGFLNAETYWLNGRELAGALKIEKPSFYHSSLVAAQCFLFIVNSYVTRSVKSWDEANIKFTRKYLYDALIYNKSKGALGYQTKYTFKWIPDLVNTTTPLGKRVPEQSKTSGLFQPRSLEQTAFLTLVFAGLAMGVTSYGAVQVVKNFGGVMPILGLQKFGTTILQSIRDARLR
ncbi:hypothetical protein BX600DRAFT_506405 [Xylariales sp. PMI_506]|nr:hypothetical protein BX600DRAFT_506405 [Xylariales sp. PMI_506]